MLNLENAKKKEESTIKVMSLPLQQQCFDKNWILKLKQPKQINHLMCLICGQIANNPIEISCPEHEKLDELLIAGENCLKQYLNNNNNVCPVQPHDSCQYVKSKVAQRQIAELNVICPMQFEQSVQQSSQHQQTIMCNFKGKIKDLNDHLENSCPIKLSNCWFKPFGCNHTCHKSRLNDHLISHLQFHFDLVIKSIESLKQHLQAHQNEIGQLQLQNEKLKLEIQLERKQSEEKITLIKEHSQAIQSEIEILKRDINDKIKRIQDNETEHRQIHANCHKSLQRMKLQQNQALLEDNDNPSPSLSSDFNIDLFRFSKQLKTFSGHSNVVWSVQYSPFDGGRFLCSGSSDSTARVWDVETTKQIHIFNGHSGNVHDVKFSAYNYCNYRHFTIFSASSDKTIRFWDIKTGKELQVLSEHTGPVYSIQFSSFNNGRYLCSGSGDKSIRLWDIQTFSSLNILNGHTDYVWCVEFSPLQSSSNDKDNANNGVGVIGGSGYTICSGSWDKTIRLWDVETGKELIVLEGSEGYVRSVKYSPYEATAGGNTVYSGSDDKMVRLWDIRSKKQTSIFKGHTSYVTCVVYPPYASSNDITGLGGNIIYSGSRDNTIRLWDIRVNKQFSLIKGSDSEDSGIFCVAFSSPEDALKSNEQNKNNRIEGNTLCYGSIKGLIRLRG
ncbi:G-protein beta WD-40 repeats containing protein [Reticulomyxa filosa]|uniref:G-protein beta WD-40 repeats containing protein n=1 Tax=Reticulomyxa filosa TaxID=46433 RepID=X6P219_RETFI|nr:G-protein beta WD-40 repeats containing protein [Reticulomyxa filosa]|eukprot:ETO32183.1 G-protein beta WD-40 repeats containing protein [Reticulomyxa filosa]